MEYASQIDNEALCDLNYIKHVGWEESNPNIKKLFSKETIDIISRKITELTMGVDPQNRPIVVPPQAICGILSEVYASFRPNTGDIFTRYNIPSGTGPQNYVQDLIDQTIEIITNNISYSIGMEENNKKLTIWTTVYGDFNQHGLRQHAPIKVLNKRPNPMEFHMRY
tara:strand:+ start:336 stop:836 length:501 start_codon:yes stop_codon:yes gene_type:complete